MKTIHRFLAVTLIASAMSGAIAASHSAASMIKSAPPAAATALPMAEGEIRKINKSAGKITIKHGPLASLDMPPMTMVFRVKDPSMLDQVKPGDKITFVAERVNGLITVTDMKAAQQE